MLNKLLMEFSAFVLAIELAAISYCLLLDYVDLWRYGK